MRDDRGFVDTSSNQKGFTDKHREGNSGPFIGVVATSVDPLLMGRLGVNIPALTTTTQPAASQIIWCRYLSPFYGSKPLSAVSNNDLSSYKENQTSYGFWAVPPDVGTEVLVIFAKGENNENSAFWIGCVQQPKVNQQVPGLGSTTRTERNARELARTGQTNYGTDFLPVGDLNRNFSKGGRTLSNANKWDLPVNDILADQLLEQGLIQDDIRGTTSSSAARETPSQVFGINTPGPIRSDSRKLNIGLEGSTVRPDRDLGHSFVMDDGDVNGNNQLTRLRTASGHQLLMHDSKGVVYLANGSGKTFIEMDSEGHISIYSNKGISIRSAGDFNLHSDKDINFHAKQKIKFTAEQHVAVNAEKYVYVMGQSGILAASQGGAVRHYARDGISSYTDGTQLHGAGGRIDLAGTQVHFNSVVARRSWGPSWLKPNHGRIGIKVGQNNDIVADKPFQNGRKNTKKTKSSIKQDKFVTHEPFDRK